MAWPQRVYVATKTLGVYYCEAFTAVGDQPVWNTINGGLASTAIISFCLDRHEIVRDSRMFCIADGVLYRRTIGDWVAILTSAEARAMGSFVVGQVLRSVVVDPVTGYVHVLLARDEKVADVGVLTSTDHGATWMAVVAREDDFIYTFGNLDACNGLVVCGFVTHPLTNSFLYSINSGGTWATLHVSDGYSLPTISARIHPASMGLWYGTIFVNYNYYELVRCSTVGSYERLQAGYAMGPYETGGGFWFNESDVNNLATTAEIRDTTFNVTTDAFATIAASGVTSVPHMHEIGDGCQGNNWLHGCSFPSSDRARAPLYISYDGVTLTHRSGANWNTLPYTDAIPVTCGGVTPWGLWCVIEKADAGPMPGQGSVITPPGGGSILLGGDAYVQAVTMPDYTGDRRGEPMSGDRGVWAVDTEVHGQLHASDIAAKVARYHLPVWDVVLGEAAIWNGVYWEAADVLTPMEHTVIGDSAPHHAAVTLDSAADVVLALAGQTIDLDTQTANRVLAGPTTGAAAAPTFRAMVNADLPDPLGFKTPASALVITAGAVTATQNLHTLTSESGTTDDLTTITVVDRMLLLLQATATHTITVKHGTGNIALNGAADFVLSDNKALLLYCMGAAWVDVGAGGGGTGLAQASCLNVVIDGGGAAITPGIKGDVELPWSGVIGRATLLADQTGSIVVDIWRSSYTGFPPTSAGRITGTTPPTITSGVRSQDAVLSGWTTAFPAGDILRFNIDSCAAIQRVTLSLLLTRQ